MDMNDTISNLEVIEDLYPDHTFSYIEDIDGYGGYRMIIDDKYTDIWLYEHMLYGTDVHDLEYIREEIDWYLNNEVK